MNELEAHEVSSVDDAAWVATATCLISPPASPALINHDVDRRVNFVIVVDPAALASSDDPVEAQEALLEDPGLDDPPGDETTSDAAGEDLEALAGELELDGAEIVEPEPSTIATALGAMARRRPTVAQLNAQDCRYPIGDVEVVGEFSTRTQIIFCGEPIAPGSQSWCGEHHELCHAALKSSQTLRQENIARKLSRLAIVAALKRE